MVHSNLGRFLNYISHVYYCDMMNADEKPQNLNEILDAEDETFVRFIIAKNHP